MMTILRPKFYVILWLQACTIVTVYYFLPLKTIVPYFSRQTEENNFGLVSRWSDTIFYSQKRIKETDLATNNSEAYTINTVRIKQASNKFFICHRPTGRLGNQMFDFASALGIARLLNYRFIVPPSNPLLTFFEINQTLPASQINKLKNVQKIHILTWRNETWRNSTDYLSYNLTLRGCYRIWKYFDQVSDEVKNLFHFKPFYLGQAETFLMSVIQGSKTLIGVHVRRGDFLSKSAKEVGRLVVGVNYLSKAMNYFRKQYINALFVVVSNDKKWCMDHLTEKDVVFSTFDSAIIDMAILNLCNHTIISTGTFGWWGGWLAGGTVVYCEDYPKPGSFLDNNILFREDFYPPSWIGMPNDS